MSGAILGISAYYHDSAACLVAGGEIVAAAQEERFSRVKHDAGFPHAAIRYCLEAGGIARSSDLSAVVFYDKPLLKFERLLLTSLRFAPRGVRSFLTAMPVWLDTKLFIRQHIQRELDYAGPILFTEHHASHAASAFFPSPFESAAILTVDGVGEWATASLGHGRDNRLELTHELHFPHSLGLLYSAFTYYCGFRVNSGEYKLMGLAPYGEPRFAAQIYDRLIDLKDDGSFRLDQRYFDYCAGLTMTSPAFDELFGGPPRKPESPLTAREMDLAASVQLVTEDVMLRLARFAHRATGEKNLVLAGGVALNCVANGRILRDGPFDRLWIQPAAGDAGGALGAALFVHHQLDGGSRRADGLHDAQHASLLGPAFGDAQIEAALGEAGVPARRITDRAALARYVAERLIAGDIVGWFQGRMEFGPRALGSRSILADARRPEMQSQLNLKTKFRESFRPFAPVVLAEHAPEIFDLASDSPYMLLTAPVREQHRLPLAADRHDLASRLSEVRSRFPAITHVDFSARLQTVRRDDNPRLHQLLSAFHAATGCPLLVNTSFNVRGEPIVCTPADALRCVRNTQIDLLILEDFVVDRREAGLAPPDARYAAQFPLD